MTDKPSEAAIREACRRAGYCNLSIFEVLALPDDNPMAVLAASLIEKFEPDTLIDPVTKRAREICVDALKNSGGFAYDDSPMMFAIIRALKEGMPK